MLQHEIVAGNFDMGCVAVLNAFYEILGQDLIFFVTMISELYR